MLARLLPAALGVAGLGGLLWAFDPARLGAALGRFDGRVLPMVGLSVLVFYSLQGMRWHLLLRAIGVRPALKETLLLNMAGQAVTALVPLGDLTRAALVSAAWKVPFGNVAATVTVQEMVYTLALIVVAAPALLALHFGAAAFGLALAGVLGALAVLSVPALFGLADRALASLPLMSRLSPQLRALRQQTLSLLRQPRTAAGSLLDLARVGTMVSLLWLLIQGLEPGSLDWERCALVLAASYVGGAISLVPGGIGANEATMAGMLVLLGVEPGAAAATAVLQRAVMTGSAGLLGGLSYLAAQHRFGFSGLLARAPARGSEGGRLRPAA